MTAPGVGPVVAMTYKAAIDDPERFNKSKDVGPYFGLTPSKYQSGEVDWTGHISKVGDETVRAALYEAANIILSRVTRFSALKAWAMRVAKVRGLKRAKVALARKLAVVPHRVWIAQWIIRAIENRAASVGEVFNTVSEQAVTLRGYTETVYRWFGASGLTPVLFPDSLPRLRSKSIAIWLACPLGPKCPRRPAAGWLDAI